MPLELVTGHTGESHVTSAQAGALNAAFSGIGCYSLKTRSTGGISRGITASTNGNTVTITDGDVLINGRHVSFEGNTSITIENGAQGLSRLDVIAVKYEKDQATQIESASLCVFKGTAADEPQLPEVPEASIIDGATVAYMPLFTVSVNGGVINEPMPFERNGRSNAPMVLGVPVGSVTMFAGPECPTGWLPCDGRAINRYEFAELFAAIGTTYGGGGALFNLPNMNGRFPLGAAAPGSSGGSATVTLTTANMPAHSHTVEGGAHSHALAENRGFAGVTTEANRFTKSGKVDKASKSESGYYVAGGTITNSTGIYGTTAETTPEGFTCATAGDGEPHENMPPYVGLRFIIKAW